MVLLFLSFPLCTLWTFLNVCGDGGVFLIAFFHFIFCFSPPTTLGHQINEQKSRRICYHNQKQVFFFYYYFHCADVLPNVDNQQQQKKKSFSRSDVAHCFLVKVSRYPSFHFRSPIQEKQVWNEHYHHHQPTLTFSAIRFNYRNWIYSAQRAKTYHWMNSRIYEWVEYMDGKEVWWQNKEHNAIRMNGWIIVQTLYIVYMSGAR